MVCSNSFRSDDDEQNAVGLLHWEMRAAGGLIIGMADAHRLPAGGALAVDRDPFAEAVTARLAPTPASAWSEGEIAAALRRPLDHRHRAAHLPALWPRRSAAETGEDALAFFDAIAPIVYADTST
jgi:methylenetetrahydrofolate--tRNA-(uracil-5-)-methyltransferase